MSTLQAGEVERLLAFYDHRHVDLIIRRDRTHHARGGWKSAICKRKRNARRRGSGLAWGSASCLDSYLREMQNISCGVDGSYKPGFRKIGDPVQGDRRFLMDCSGSLMLDLLNFQKTFLNVAHF